MIQYRKPIRMNTPQRLEYTFKDYSNTAIDLSAYDSVYVQVKHQGDDVEEEVAAFVSKPDGTVRYVGYTFTQDGEWIIQFRAAIGTGDSLYGEPIRIRVVENADNLDANELLEY